MSAAALALQARQLDRRCTCRSCGKSFTVSALELAREHAANIDSYGAEAGPLADTLNGVEFCRRCR